MRHKLISLVLAAILPLLLILPATAQDDTAVPFVLCGELDSADCAILEESALAMSDVTASSFDIQFDASIGGLPDMPVDPIAFTLAMTGQWAVDDGAHNAIRSMGALNGADPAAAQAMAKQIPTVILDLYRGLSFDVSLTWDVPQNVADLIAEDADVPFPPTLTWNMRMVDGMMYVDLSELKALAPELTSVKADWIGFDMVGLMQMLLDQSQPGGNQADDAFATGVGAGAGATQMLKLIQDYVTVERLDDVNVADQTAAVFQYTPDMVGFFTSKIFRTEFLQIAAAAAANAGDTSTAEMEKNLSMLGFVAPLLFRDLTVDSTTTIGLDDSYTYLVQTEFKWDLSGLMQLAAMSDPSLAESLPAGAVPTINYALDATYGQYNDALEFAAPEDVEIIPLDQLTPGDTSLVY